MITDIETRLKYYDTMLFGTPFESRLIYLGAVRHFKTKSYTLFGWQCYPDKNPRKEIAVKKPRINYGIPYDELPREIIISCEDFMLNFEKHCNLKGKKLEKYLVELDLDGFQVAKKRRHEAT